MSSYNLANKTLLLFLQSSHKLQHSVAWTVNRRTISQTRKVKIVVLYTDNVEITFLRKYVVNVQKQIAAYARILTNGRKYDIITIQV